MCTGSLPRAGKTYGAGSRKFRAPWRFFAFAVIDVGVLVPYFVESPCFVALL